MIELELESLPLEIEVKVSSPDKILVEQVIEADLEVIEVPVLSEVEE